MSPPSSEFVTAVEEGLADLEAGRTVEHEEILGRHRWAAAAARCLMRVIGTTRARRDLEGIWTYIARDNAVAADGVDDDIVKAGEFLAGMPRRGRPGRHSDTRELLIPGRPDIVVYTLRGETVAILRIVHMAQDWPPRTRQG